MALDNYPSAGVIVLIVLGICFGQYCIPIITAYKHCFCSGEDKTRRNGEQDDANVATIDVENQYVVSKEESKEIFKSEKSVSRVLSMNFTFWTYFWVIYFTVTSGLGDEDIQKGTRLILNVLGYIHLPVFILFLWIETFFSWEYDYLSTILEEKTCKTYIQELKELKPVIILGVGAYHYEMKTTTYTYTGANGQLMTGSTVRQERVQDHTEYQQFPFVRWVDCSPDPNNLDLNPGKVTRVKMLKLILLGDDETKAEFDRLRGEMEAKVKDMYPNSEIEFAQDDGILGFVDRLCSYWESDERKWWTNKCFYIILSFLLLTWFYRIAFSFATQSTCFRVVKKVYISDNVNPCPS